jgi:hypothetical protein
MAELVDEHGSGDFGRTGTSELVSGMHLNAGKLLEAVRSLGDHRSIAGVSTCGGATSVNTGSMLERAGKKDGRVRRCVFSPGC